MSIVSIVIIAAIGVFALIGLVTGAVKGFTRVHSWAVELLLTGVIGIAVSSLTASKMNGGIAPALIALGVSVVLLCLFMFLFAIFRMSLKKRIEKRKQRSYYEHYDEIEDNTEQILCAIGAEDKKRYKKLSKRKIKQSGGAWSVIDKVFGALVLAIKGAVIAGLIFAVLLTSLEFTRLSSGALSGFVGSLYESGIWLFFKNYIFDFIVIAIVMACIKSGYESGLITSLWKLVVLGLVIGAAVLSFYLSFKVDEFVTAAERFSTHLPESITNFLSTVGITSLRVAEVIIGLGLFVAMLVAVIILAVFVPKLIDRARNGMTFSVVDGILGAVVLTVLILGILLVVGAVINSLYDVEFMNVFNAYFEKSGIATYFYDKNLLNQMNILTNLPIKNWFS